MRTIIIGGGTDGPGWSITFENGKIVIKPLPGWNPEQLVELGAALNVMRDATKLKSPRLAEAAIHSVWDFAQKQFDQHLKGDAVMVI